MSTFSESTTGLGLILPEAAHTAWEGIAWQNQHLTGWVLEAQNGQTRLVTGDLDLSGTPHRLNNVQVRWVLADGTHQEGPCSDLDISYDPAYRKVYYVDFDQMDPGDPSKHLIQEMALPNFEDFAPTEKQFPLLHVGQYPHEATGNTDFAKWVAPRLDKTQEMPVGTILMYDGNAWVDNQTMLGWYACTGGTVPNDGRPAAGQTIPDLVDRFVMGGSSSDYGNFGGANSFNLALSQMPGHTHSMQGHTHSLSSHTHSGTTGVESTPHSHNMGIGNIRNGSTLGYNNSLAPSYTFPAQNGNNAYTDNPSQQHNHGFLTGGPSNNTSGGPSVGSTAGPDGWSSQTSIDNRPAFYQLIFIKRMA